MEVDGMRGVSTRPAQGGEREPGIGHARCQSPGGARESDQGTAGQGDAGLGKRCRSHQLGDDELSNGVSDTPHPQKDPSGTWEGPAERMEPEPGLRSAGQRREDSFTCHENSGRRGSQRGGSCQ